MFKKTALLSFTLLSLSCTVVDTGKRGIERQFGKIKGEPLAEGLYFYNPLMTDILQIDVREQKIENTTQCFTRDTQKVTLNFVMTYYPDPTKIHEIYRSYGADWASKIILSTTLGSVKDTIGKYVADDLVGKREEAKKAAYAEIAANLKEKNILVTQLNFTHLQFEPAYEKAVEDKVVAVQSAYEAKNKTVEVQEKANQQLISAKAEAESMRIRAQALEMNKGLVEYEAVQKWDGKLPQYMMGNSVPFINIDKK